MSKPYAIVFPGQGSQSTGMLADIAAAHPVVRDTFAEAGDTLGYDLWSLVQNGPDEKLSQTEFTQPVMYTSGVALWRLWEQQLGDKPAVVAGHSLGEFAALTAAGSLPFESGVALVNERARLMAGAVAEGEGGMAALIGMDDDAVVALCESLTGERIVEAVNFNSPGQVAVSGHNDAIDQLVAVAKDHGARKAVKLAVSVPNHSSLMQDAGVKLAVEIDAANLAAPAVPVMQNTRASVPETLDELVSSLKQHVYSPVRWTDSYRNILSTYAPEVVIELGPGKVLAGLGKRIDRQVPVEAVDRLESLESALAAVGN